MNGHLDDIRRRIRALEEEMEAEMARAAEQFRYTITERRILFEESVAAYHRRLRKNWARFIAEADFRFILIAPVIYAMIVPLLFLDAALYIYQAICFPVFGVRKVRRADFIVIDRHYLSYLNFIERFNCAYCGYGNGLFAYAREVGARTEEFWCPIKHARRIKDAHSAYGGFEEYGDADGWRKRMAQAQTKKNGDA